MKITNFSQRIKKKKLSYEISYDKTCFIKCPITGWRPLPIKKKDYIILIGYGRYSNEIQTKNSPDF